MGLIARLALWGESRALTLAQESEPTRERKCHHFTHASRDDKELPAYLAHGAFGVLEVRGGNHSRSQEPASNHLSHQILSP